jgi:ELWxxDGT repeat protein
MKFDLWQYLAGSLPGMRKARTQSGHRPPSRRPTFRPRLEVLEDRTLLSASLVRDINLNTAGSSPTNLTDVNGLLYFSATDNAGNIALYTSDGTASRTVRVKEFGPANDNPSTGLFNLTNVNGTLFFDVSDNSNGRAELWQSNGTAAGTRLVKDFHRNSFVNSNGSSTFVSFNNNLYFIVQQPSFSSNIQLWKSDGTTTTQIGPGSFSVEPSPQFTVANNTLFFAAGDPTTGSHPKLWKTDGTGGGPQIADSDVAATGVDGLTNVNGTLYFFAVSDPTLQTTDFYQSDGTHTTLIQSGFGDFFREQTAVVNGKLFFSASPPTGAFAFPELWVFDPSNPANPPQNPRLLQPAHVGSVGLDPFNLTSVNGLLVFNGSDDAGDVEPVWVSDGTDAGTRVLFPNTAAFATLFPSEVAVANNKLYFGAQGAGTRQQLWQTDGTPAGTSMIFDFGRVPFTGGPPST